MTSSLIAILTRVNSIPEARKMTFYVIYIAYNILCKYIEGYDDDGICHLNNLEYTMKLKKLMIKGIGKKYRQRLTEVLEKAQGYIDLELVHKTLNIPRPLACTYLSRWTKNGWLKRIKRGIYVPIDLTTKDLSLPIEDPWIIAHALFSPCYLGGWTAAQHWDFTEQIFNNTFVFSTRKLGHSHQKIGTQNFIVKRTATKKMFGLKPIWKDSTKVLISDPHKTIIDILADPSIAGGIRSGLDFLESYLHSPHKNMELLLEYAKNMENKTIFKRLGYLLSMLGSSENKIISSCFENISKGYSHLDPSSREDKLVTKWKLWVPKNLKWDHSKAQKEIK